MKWAAKAACVGLDPAIFFPESAAEVGDAEAKRQLSIALVVCARCPVTAECLEHAFAANERQGVWGGMSARTRRTIRARRHRDAQETSAA